jgi:hypothetical protein
LGETVDSWQEILREAIGGRTHPLIGTHFRAAVGSLASKRGLQFPPPEEPGLRFIQLLERYPDVVSVLRRPGQDFLVAPAGRSDLLAGEIQQRLYFIRPDLFGAFTVVTNDHLHYDKARDRVVWQKAGDTPPSPDSVVPIEPTTMAAELQLRRDFAETVADHSLLPAHSCSAL